MLYQPHSINLFVVLACQKPELDGLDEHFQATVHSPLTSAVDWNLGNSGNQTRGCWVRSKYATSVLCMPPPIPSVFGEILKVLKSQSKKKTGDCFPSCSRPHLRKLKDWNKRRENERKSFFSFFVSNEKWPTNFVFLGPQSKTVFLLAI